MFLPQYGPVASMIAYGQVPAPVAGATVVALGSAPAAGLWKVETITHMWGSLGGTVDNNNMQLANVPGGPWTLNADAGTGTVINYSSEIYSLDGTQIPTVKAISNASASTVYSCRIVATRVAGSSGWASQ